MTIKPIITVPNEILKKISNPIENVGDNEKKLVNDLFETMYDSNGIGLAAPQIHISKRIIIFRNPEKEEKDKIQITALINPTFKPIHNDQEDDWEGCLSIPGMQGRVRRFKKISYSGYDINGNKIENLAEGLHARVVQHEIDHLNGVLYTERLADNKAFGFEKEIIEYWKNEKTKEKN